MKNRHDDTPEINDYTYYVFEEIEKRGLQFAIPDQWRPVYRAFLRERQNRRKVVQAFNGIVRAFEVSERSFPGSYKDDFGSKGAAAREEDSKANNSTRPLEE